MTIVRPHAPAAALFGAVGAHILASAQAAPIPATHLFYPIRNTASAMLAH